MYRPGETQRLIDSVTANIRALGVSGRRSYVRLINPYYLKGRRRGMSDEADISMVVAHPR
jgi:hypothetical protein